MKHILKSYILLALFSLLMIGCSSDDGIDGAGDPVAVQFGTGNIAVPKTTLGGDQWTAGDRIGIFMKKSGEMLASTSIMENADNIQYKAQTGGAASSGFIPADATTIYYPVDASQKVDFIAYYPYKSSLTDYIYPVNVSDQSKPEDIDVLYSNSATSKDKRSGTVDLQFKHALSKLSFTLVPGVGAPDLTGAKVEITDLATEGYIDLSDALVMYDLANIHNTITANTAADGLSSSAIVMPQPISRSKVVITLSDGVGKFECDLPTVTFAAGYNYSQTITVSKTGITISSGGISIWGGADGVPTPGTAKPLVQYKVGDYYPDPANAGTAIGVVFWIDPAASGYSGKIVGLTEASDTKWGTERKDNANDMDNGITNMNTIYKRNTSNPFRDYPAFKWVHSLNNSTENYSDASAKSIWYLPSANELKALYAGFSGVVYENVKDSWNNWDGWSSDSYMPNYSSSACGNARDSFNQKLSDAGGEELKTSDWDWPDYLSSTEYSNQNAYFIRFNYAQLDTYFKSTADYYIRAILAF